MSTDAERRQAIQNDPQWREVVKPLFLKMHRDGVRSIELRKDGTWCHASLELDEGGMRTLHIQ